MKEAKKFKRSSKILIKARYFVGDLVIFMSQIFLYVSVSRILRFYFKANKKIDYPSKSIKNGSLIISNHQSMLDPFVITAYLPFRDFLKIIPIRYPTSHRHFMKMPFLAFFGAYSIGGDKRSKMLKLFLTREHLARGRSIMLFPEGKICYNPNEGMSEFQKGVTFLTDIANNVLIVRMEGFHSCDWIKLWRKHRSMAFSDLYNFQGKDKDVNDLKECLEQLPV